ncbi:MAG TPA: diguanylate cyclase, partial [Magnetococcales bacterium]|nr:diguanylate cyclase [Magnetococcales bacterium]
DLSASEASTPFFKPSFDLPAGEVYVSRPYMSTDVAEWVFAYTSPVVLDDGTIPAFYHFEIPLSLFQKFITDASTPRRNNTSTEKVDPLSDRMFIQTIDGLVIVDSAKATDFLQKPEFIREGKPNLEDYLSHVRTISNDPGFLALMEQARAGNEGYGHFDTDSKRYFVSYKSLPQFDWSLVRVQSYENLLKGDSSLAGIRNMILFTVFLVLIVGTVAVRIVSGHITQPLKLLSAAMHDLEENRFRDDLPIESNDELGKIVALFNEMSREIRRNQSFLLQERNKLTTIIHTTREGIIVSDQDDAVVLVNPSAERLLDKTAEQIRSEGFFNLVDEPDYIKSYINPDNKNLPEVVVYKGRVLNFYASSFLDQNGGKIGSIALMRDVTQEKQLESELRKISVTDKLTGLFNRRWLEEFMVKEFSRASRYHLELSVLFFDVDHFKKFNDTYGHDMGDLVLESIGEAARSNLRQSDYSCRYGGEEFCLVLTNTGSSGAMLVAENFRRKIEDMEVRSMKVTISIGVASYPQAKVNNPMELVKLADKALYAVKRSGRNRVMHWSDLEAAATSWD